MATIRQYIKIIKFDFGSCDGPAITSYHPEA